VTPTDRFKSIEQQREPEPKVVLRDRSGGKSITLDAASLVEQYAVSPTLTLLVLDEDSPYEEQLHLVLLRKSKKLDHIVIGAPYTTGVFRVVDADKDTLRFRFESDAVWSVSANAKGQRGIGGLPRGARRRGGIFVRRYLKLEHGGVA